MSSQLEARSSRLSLGPIISPFLPGAAEAYTYGTFPESAIFECIYDIYPEAFENVVNAGKKLEVIINAVHIKSITAYYEIDI